MSINEITASNFGKYPIGKFIGSTKIRYEWELIYQSSLLKFVVLYSKLSGSFRLFLNDIKLVEILKTDPEFEVTIRIDQNKYIFYKRKEEIRLMVNAIQFEDIFKSVNLAQKKEYSTLDNKTPKNRLVEFSGTQKSLYNTEDSSVQRKFGAFVFEWVMGVCVVRHVHQSRLAKEGLFGNRHWKQNSLENVKTFQFLEDSTEIYPHEFLFLFTQEVSENFDLVGQINGQKIGSSLESNMSQR